MKTARKIEGLISWVDHQFMDELIALGVTRNGYHWGVLFEGKRDALIAAGIAGSDWFSDCTARNKRGFIVRQKRFLLNGREVKTGVPAEGRCTVSIRYTEQELADCYPLWLKHSGRVNRTSRGIDEHLFEVFLARQNPSFQKFMHTVIHFDYWGN